MSQYVKKSRRTIDLEGSLTTYFTLSGSVYPGSVKDWKMLPKYGVESVGSANHGWPGRRSVVRDVGGSFVSSKTHWHGGVDASAQSNKVGSVVYHRRGILFPIDPHKAVIPTVMSASDNEMIGFGTAGFNRAAPTKAISSAAEFVGEMRQLPSANLGLLLKKRPSPPLDMKLPDFPGLSKEFGKDILLMRSKARQFRDLARQSGNAYLNVEFGWLPFIRGIRDMLEAHRKSAQIANQFARDNGRVVRRRIPLVSTVEVGPQQQQNPTYGYPAGVTYLYSSRTYVYQTDTVSREAWFSGAFTYFVPGLKGLPPGSLKKNRAIQAKLYGNRITPELLWNLSPWTWLIDYGGNMGQILENLSMLTNDNLVCLYGYAMCHDKVTRTWTAVIPFKSGGAYTSLNVVVETKQRARGNPFGFSASGPLSNKQSAILSALALSRTK